MKPGGGMTREERWELRRKQKLGMQPELKPAAAAPPPFSDPPINPVFESKPAPSYSPAPQTFQQPQTKSSFVPSFEPSQMPEPRTSLPQQGNPSFQQMEPTRLSYQQPSSGQAFPPMDRDQARGQPPPAELGRVQRVPTPQGDSFFTNPVSDQEVRRKQAQNEYRQHMQESVATQGRQPRRMTPPEESGYVPVNRGERVSRSQIPMTQLSDQKRAEVDQKRQYQQELLRQMKDNEDRKKRRNDDPSDGESFFKFGRPGAGAPNRDAAGNIVATRAPKYNENDPRFVNPNRGGYQGQPPMDYPPPPATYSPNPRAYNPPPGPPQYGGQPYYAEPPQQPYQDQYAPRGYDPRGPPPPYDQPPPRYPDNDGGRYMPQPPQVVDPPPMGNRYSEPDMSRYPPPQYQQPAYDGVQPPLPPEFPPGKQASPLRVNPVVGGDNLVRLEGDFESASKLRQKSELARALQEQMEEKKRRQDEEKRQKLLEERLEEAKLEKQRLDMEEEYRREIEKKKKEYRDFQSANEVAGSGVVVAPRKPKRQRTPIDFPVAEPPRSPPRDPPGNYPPPIITEVMQRSVPVEAAQQVNSQMENELWRLRNEMVNQNNELKESLAQLRQQSLQANQQRFEAVKELERVREEMKLRAHEEEIRQRELFMAISKNPTRQVYEPTTRLPAANPLPLVLPRSHPDDPLNTLGFDVADKSLTAESKFLPVVGTSMSDMPPPPRKREMADASLVSLPEFGPSNVPATTTMDAGLTAGTTLGIEAISRRNEERLLALERLEGSGMDEISKLDALMANYLDAERKLGKPSSSKGNGRPSNLASRGKMVVSKPALGSIPEADGEGSFSLPSLSGDPVTKAGNEGGWKYSMNS